MSTYKPPENGDSGGCGLCYNTGMSETPNERWPWLTLPRALAIAIVVPGLFLALNYYFDTLWWQQLVIYMRTKIIFHL